MNSGFAKSRLVFSCAVLVVSGAVWLSFSAPLAAKEPQQQRRDPGAASRNFLGLGAKPDEEAAKRGAPVFAANCSFCHGPTARGAEGPSLLTSDVVLSDNHGEKFVPFVKEGRPDKGMPSFARLDESKLSDIAEYLHLEVEKYANRGLFEVANILTGDPQAGKVYFDSKCSRCHSVSGDLAHIGAKYRPSDLQRYWISPQRNIPTRAVAAVVTTPQGTINGELVTLSDFVVSVRDSAGQVHKTEITPSTQVKTTDPLAYHMEMIPTLRDDDMHNVTAYLEKQK